MTMTPEDFRRHFDDAVADEPVRPIITEEIVAAGERTVRRRRVGAVVLAVALVLGAAGTVGLLSDADRRVDPAPTPTATATATPSPEPAAFPSGDELLELCRNGRFQDPATAREFFASGTPMIMATADVGFQGSAALMTPNGLMWAWCRVEPGDPDNTGMDVFLDTGRRNTMFFYSGVGCAALRDPQRTARACSTFTMRWTERFPPRIKAVELVMANGEVVRLRTTQGFVVLEYLGPIPPGTPRTRDGSLRPGRFEPYRRLTCIEADGRRLERCPHYLGDQFSAG